MEILQILAHGNLLQWGDFSEKSIWLEIDNLMHR